MRIDVPYSAQVTKLL